jgi:hypothetical protein
MGRQGKYVQQREVIKSVSPKSEKKLERNKLLPFSLSYLAERRNQLLQRQDPLSQPLPPHLPPHRQCLGNFFFYRMMMSSLIEHKNRTLIMSQIRLFTVDYWLISGRSTDPGPLVSSGGGRRSSLPLIAASRSLLLNKHQHNQLDNHSTK